MKPYGVAIWLSSEVSEVFCGTKHLLSQIRFNLARTMSNPEMSVVLKLLKFLKKLKFLRETKLMVLGSRENNTVEYPMI